MASVTDSELYGVQVSGGLSGADEAYGVQAAGFVNFVKRKLAWRAGWRD